MTLRGWPLLGISAALLTACVTPACLTGAGAGSAADIAEGEGELRFRPGPVDATLPEVDAVGYEIALRVDDHAGAEVFEADVRGTYVTTTPLTELALDLEGNEIDGVWASGRVAAYRREGARLIVTLPAPVAKGAELTTRVKLHGAVRQADGKDPNDFQAYGGLMVRQRNAEGRRIFTSLDWPSKARRWLPLRDHPRDGAMVAVRATFSSAYTVVANGKALGVRDNPDGTRTWSYEAMTPMPTYDIHVAAYDGWTKNAAQAASGVPVVTYAYGRSATKVPAVYGDLARALDGYEAAYGRYRWGTAAFLEEPIFGGGMEHATVVSMDETLFANPSVARRTAFHELGHHWSGNLVRIRTWNDFWLSEGLTEYLTAKAIGFVDGAAAESATFQSYLATALASDRLQPHPIRPPDPEIDVLTIFDGISYQKGACVMRWLSHVVGEPAFTTFLRGWFDRHAFGAVTTADLEKELSAATGKDLAPFFRDVVYAAGHPQLAVSLVPDAADPGAPVVRVEQLQTGGPAGGYHVPLDVDLVAADGKTTRLVVALTGPVTEVKVPPGSAAVRLVADPDRFVVGGVTTR